MADATGLRLPHRAPDPRPDRPGPAERPSPGLRSAIGGVGIALAALTAVLLLSDRAPVTLQAAFGDTAAGVANRFDLDARAMLLLSGGLPEADTIFHIGLWAAVTILVALTSWTWRGAIGSALAVFASSALLEWAQGHYASTRVVEFRDVTANALGVGLGLCIAVTCMSAWTIASRTRRRLGHRTYAASPDPSSPDFATHA